MSAEWDEPMTSESARDVLREAMADAMGGIWTGAAGIALDALAAHPVELLALITEPKVCETCGGAGRVKVDTYHGREAWERCPTCPKWTDGCGTGWVAVDVLDLLVQAGLVEQVGWGSECADGHPSFFPWLMYADRRKMDDADRPVYVAKVGTP